MKTKTQVNFRPCAEIQGDLNRADELRLNVSEIINSILKKNLKSEIAKHEAQIRKILSASPT